MVNQKPRILLIPNVAWWIIGDMGKQIMARFGGKYDFLFVTEGILERRPELLKTIVPAVDAIHCLNESSIELFRDIDSTSLPPIATWIHHVTVWSPSHQLAVERSDVLTVCTSTWQQYLDSRTAGRVPTIRVPHGVDASFFSPREADPKRFGVPQGSFVVGFLGNKGSDSDQGRKGTDVLFTVIRKLATHIKNLHVVLGGPGWERELAELTSAGVSASATGYIRKADLPDLYSVLDVYLLTSRVEGGPCTVFEAMACETSVVATRVGAVPELIQDGVNGFSADVDDVEALASAIVLLANEPARNTEIRRSARQTVLGMPWSAVLAPLESVYDQLVQEGRKRKTRLEGPDWMKDPDALLRASCAADALVNVIPRVRTGSVTVRKGLRLLVEMLHNQSVADIVRGAAMVKGWAFR